MLDVIMRRLQGQRDQVSLVQAQNRKLDVLLVVVGMVSSAWLWLHVGHGVGFIAGLLVVAELLQEWGGLAALVFAPVLLIGWLHMRLTKRQLGHRTVYTIAGTEFVAQPITRAVQERLVAMVPDSAFEDSPQLPAGLLAAMGGAVPEQPDPAAQRRTWMQSIDSTYEQLALLLVYKANPDPDVEKNHPSVDWLGSHCPVARATSLLQEVQQRAQVEDNLPS